MIEKVKIPIFPLSILPIPNERVPLHIFEPRYKQLVSDIIAENTSFGIYYSHGLNKDRLGGLVKLENQVKTYDGGESDIVVKCTDTFILSNFFNRIPPKLYPGGIIVTLNATQQVKVSNGLLSDFREFLAVQGRSDIDAEFDIHDIANELQLNIEDRLKYLKLLDIEKREAFLKERLRYQKFILKQERKIKDNFFLN